MEHKIVHSPSLAIYKCVTYRWVWGWGGVAGEVGGGELLDVVPGGDADTLHTLGVVGRLLRRDVLVQAVEALGQAAVHVEPPVADEVLLVEQRAVGTQEAVLGQALAVQVGAHVEGL